LYSRTYSLASGGTITLSVEGEINPFVFAEGIDARFIEDLLRKLEDYQKEYFPEEVSK